MCVCVCVGGGLTLVRSTIIIDAPTREAVDRAKDEIISLTSVRGNARRGRAA